MPPPDDDLRRRVPATLPPPPSELGRDSSSDEAPLSVEPLPGATGIAPRGRRIIAIGGGRGGVGKSVLAVNLGVFFAQLGRQVVVCDADPFGSNIHAVLGLDAPPLVSPEALEEGAAPVPTTVPGLTMLPTALDPLTATPVRRTRRSHWMAAVSALSADYVILDLGASTAPASLDVFLQADVGLCVTTPEPMAVETTYGFLRALYARALRRALRKERFKLRIVERAVATLPPLASPREIALAIQRHDEGVGVVAALEMSRIHPRLVVSQTRLRADLELGPAMAAVAERFLGTGLDYIGHIEHDDAVWLTVRRRRPLLIDSPTSKSARNLERVARRILALLAVEGARESPLPRFVAPRSAASLTLYEALGVSRTAADDEIRRAYKRQREIYREASLPLASVVTEPMLRAEQARIEEAYDTLLDPVRRRAYDLSTFPDDAPISAAPMRRSSATDAELQLLQAELAREIHAETEYSGALLRKVREAQGIDLAEIARRTKIASMHLEAIEKEAFGDLPAAVYVQGFVQEMAKYLKLDPSQVAKTYCRRMRELASGRASRP